MPQQARLQHLQSRSSSRGGLRAPFVLQAHGVPLGAAGTLVVACTATLAAIGAAAIPSAGLVTMLMVLQVSASTAYLFVCDGSLSQLQLGAQRDGWGV